MSAVVAIIGRPNVGKSTLFNRLIEQQKAIVDDTPGVTRDRNYGICHWNGTSFTVIDTGGYILDATDVINQSIKNQVLIAIEEAAVVLFVVDAKDGLMYADYEIAEVVRQKNTSNVLLVVNKTETHKRIFNTAEFYALGLPDVFPISAITGSGTGELLDAVVKLLSNYILPDIDLTIPKFAIVGRPNVGKSSLINALLERENNIVSDIPGTTRDSIYVRYNRFNFDFYLIDTAGLRKKARVDNDIEFYATIRSLRAIEACDVAILMLSAEQGIEAQDLAILHQILKHKKGIIIVLNKWDTVKKVPNIEKEYQTLIEKRIEPLRNVPILFISATEKLRIFKVIQTANQVYQSLKHHIPTRKLNEDLLPILERTPAPSRRGKLIRIKFLTQVEAKNPTFLLFANQPNLIEESYKRFIENQLRTLYGFEGCPINIYFREK